MKHKRLRSFFRQVSKDPDTGCWNWLGRTNLGYGQMRIRGKNYQVHRIAYEHWKGDIPIGYDVHHLCGNKLCVNPKHLAAMPHGKHSTLHWRAYRRRRRVL